MDGSCVLGPGTAVEGRFILTQRSEAERDRDVTALFDRHYAPLCRLAYVILGDAALAEEIVMDALLKTYTGWGRIRDLDRSDAYLKRAVVNLCRSKIRRKMVESRVNEVTHHREVLRAPDWDPERHETSRLVWAAVKTLPERQRAAVVLRYFEDLPEAQIAEVLECSVGTVKSQLSKARAKLEKQLGASLAGGVS
ncbi:MAG: SigE family RNA polymerase sigma factor [Actinobacteria bacterium]|nr:SigE family RNA polymerase sigma factor [Actinomycetota bacterium]